MAKKDEVKDDAAAQQGAGDQGDQGAAQAAEGQTQAAEGQAVEQPVAEPVKDRHPAHSALDELDEKINALGGYAVSQLKHLVEQVRSLI